MTLLDLAKKAEKLAVDNSPTILTVLGVTGVVTTAFLTGKASFKAANIIADEQYRLDLFEKSHPLEPKEKFILVWKAYIPAVGTGVLSIVCIVGANHIGSRRAAAVAAAYTISEKAFTEYKDKVVERMGAPKEQDLRDEIAQDRVNRNPSGERNIIVTGRGEVLCYDAFSDRYFESSMEELKKAQNDINYKILSEMYASLGDFYDKIGLASTSYSEEVGWTTDIPLELMLSGTLSEDQRPCISMDFRKAPIRDYHHFH